MISNRTKIWSLSILAYLFLSVASASAASDKIQSGQAGMTFDTAFLQSIKAVRFYERIVKIVGVPPVKVGEASVKVPGEKYHWNGRENTSFNIRVVSGKIIDANVVTPDGRIVSLEGNGEVNEFGK
jgi:hypothetical protein